MGTQQLAYLSYSRWQCRCNYHHSAYPDRLKRKTSCALSEPTVTSRRQSVPHGDRARCSNPHSGACGATLPPTRGFVPCSFSDAGPSACGETFMGPAPGRLNIKRHKEELFDQLGGAQHYRRRHSKAERLGGLAVHDHLKLCRELHRKIARLLAAQNAINIRDNATGP